MRLLPYAAATLIGIMPATFVYRLDRRRHRATCWRAGGSPTCRVIFSPRDPGAADRRWPLLSLLPVAWRKWRRSDA